MFSVQLSSLLYLITLIGASTAFLFGTKPVNCQVSLWSEWSEPSGSGEISRVRKILRYAVNSGDPCPTDLKQVKSTVDCKISSWSGWSEPYGFGEMSRERKILMYAANGGAACPTDLKQVKSTGKLPGIKATAKAIVNNFFHGTRHTKKRQVENGPLRDLLLIMDSSGSIPSASFSTAKSQLGDLIALLCPRPDPFQRGYQHAAMLEYSTTVNVVFDFNEYVDTAQVKQGIMSAVYQGQYTCTASAFEKAKQMFSVYYGMRTDPYVKQEVLILSDGMSNCGGNATLAARELAKTAEVFALIIGDQTPSGKAEMTEYVTAPSHKHLFVIEDFSDLDTLLRAIKMELSEQCAPFDIGKK